MDQERAWRAAFADGVSQYIAKLHSDAEELPKGIGVIEPEFFEDWDPVASLACARLLSREMSCTADYLRSRVFPDPWQPGYIRRGRRILASGKVRRAAPVAFRGPSTAG